MALPIQIPNMPDPTNEEAVIKMNQTLAMMEGQPEVVCQLFSAFASAGVVPDVESYERVVAACTAQQLWECAEWLLSAAEQQGLEIHHIIRACLEASSDLAFLLRWATKALQNEQPVPERCVPVLLRDGAAQGGVQVAVGLYQLLLKVGCDGARSAQALIHVVTELGKLTELQELCGTDGLSDGPLTAMLGSPARASPVRAEEKENAAPAARGPPPPGLAALGPAPPLEVAEETKDAQAAVRALQELKQHGPVQYPTYFRVLEVCVAAWSLPEALAVLEDMRQRHIADADAYNVLLRAHASKGRFDKCEKLVEEMRRCKVQPNQGTLNTLLDVAARTARHEKAWQLLQQMMKQDIVADKFSVSLMLKSIADKMDRAKVKRGLDLVEKYLDTQRTSADDVLFNSLLDACCRVKDVTRLERILQKMKQFDVRRSPATFGTLLKAYGQKLDLQSVLRVWSDMKAADVGVNTVTYGCMLDACVKCGHYDKADEVFEELKVSGMHRNTILYSTMIKSYSKQKKLRKALRVMDEMHTEGVPLNCVTFNSLIDAAIRCRDLPAATKLLEQMKKAGITPDLITYSTLVKGFCDHGEMEVALTLLSHLKQQGMKCDEILYNSLLEGCVKSNQAAKGLELFQEMMTDKVTASNITFSIMVKLYASAGRLDQALDLVMRMEPDFKVKPSNIVFSCLVKCCVSAQRLPQAATLLLGLPKAARVQPDQQMYALVLPGLVAQKQLDLACDVFAALCFAPLGLDSKAPAVPSLAYQLFDAVSRSSVMNKEKARRTLAAVAGCAAVAEHAHALEQQLGPAAPWSGPEFVPQVESAATSPSASTPGVFVPGQEFVPAWNPALGGDYATAAYYQAMWCQQDWAAQEWSEQQMTPMRPKAGSKNADENASPNVMDILLQSDMGSTEKASRRGRKANKASTPRTPVKMAPVVSLDAKLDAAAKLPLALSPDGHAA